MYRSPLDPYPRPRPSPPSWRAIVLGGVLALALPVFVWAIGMLPG